jgi:putative ABC transport system ATP-binding protein
MEPRLFKYIWRHSWRDQLVILAIVVLAQIFYFVSLDLPKRIVNDAIALGAFKNSPLASFLVIELPLPEILGGPRRLFDGIPLEKMGYLVALCFSFLFFVVLNGWMKQKVNTEKGRLGERMLRRLRFELFDRVLRFPLLQFRKVKQAEIATMVKDEVEPLGGFIGDAFIAPAFLGGTALTALYFIFTQSISLGLVTIGILALQLGIIPKLRVRILMLGKQRQLTARQLAGRIAENVDGATEVHVHDTSNFERADIIDRLGRIFLIRFELYQRKFLVKYLNNMLAQTTPFLFYLIGGYLVLSGEFDIGALVAVINAYKDLPSPIKELIDWDQQRQDVQIKYEQVIEQFSPMGMLDPALQSVETERDLAPAVLSIRRLAYTDESGAHLIDDVSLDIKPREHMALVGTDGSGKEALAAILARLMPPGNGQVRYGARDLFALPESVTGRRFAYVGDETFLLPLSLRDCLLYSLKHRPERAKSYEGQSLADFERRMFETRRAGNPEFDIQADWLDLAGAGLADIAALEARINRLLAATELEEDVYQFGLRGRIDPKQAPDLARRLLAARQAMRERLQEPGLAALVEPFDPKRYSQNMNVAENILFGTALTPEFAPEALGANAYLRSVLDKSDLTGDLMALGQKIAETMVELFADLPPGHPFFDQFSFIAAEDLPHFQQLVARLKKSGLDAAVAADKQRLITLTFPYIETRHRLGLIDAAMENRLLAARGAFRVGLPETAAKDIEFYEPERYNATATVQDNILFGRLVYGQAQAGQKIVAELSRIVDALSLRASIIAIGLDFNVGGAGKKLTTAQRQKVGLVRALIKLPQLVILNLALSGFDEATQRRLIANIRTETKDAALVFVTNAADLALLFDRVVVLDGGRISEQGAPAELNRQGSAFQALTNTTKA